MSRRASATTSGRYVLLFSLTAASPVQNLEVSPTLFPRALNISKAFEFYKFTSFRFRILPNTYGTNDTAADVAPQDAVVGWLPDVADALPSYGGCLELDPVAHFAIGNIPASLAPMIPCQTVPSEWRSVPRRTLDTLPTKWFKTASASIEDFVLYQGQIWCGVNSVPAASNVFVFVEFDYTIKYTGIQPQSSQ